MKTEDQTNLIQAAQDTPATETARQVEPVDAQASIAVASPEVDSPETEGVEIAGEQTSEPVAEQAEEQEADSGKKTRSRPIMRELIETVVIVVVVFLVVRALIQNFVVEGDSMLPTLHDQQYLLVNKAAYFQYDSNFFGRIFNSEAPADMRYLFGGPSRGDVVVFISPNESRDLIKRVIALEGETVEVRPDPAPIGRPDSPCGECGVYVNGVLLDEPYIRATPDYRVEPLVVPEGHVYVLGDNRRNSQDSHAFGPLALDRVIGVAFFSYWPLDGFGFLPHPGYPPPASTSPQP